MPLLWLSLAFIAGILAADWSGWRWQAWCGLGAAGLALWPLLRRLPWPWLSWAGKVQRSLKIPPILILVLFAAGGLRMQLAHPALTPADLAYYNGRGSALITAWVSAPPEQREASTLLRLEAKGITPAGGTVPQAVRGGIAAVVAAGAGWRYGDVLELAGQPVDPPEDEDFSYRAFLARQGVATYLAYPRVERGGEGAGSPVYRALYALREKAQAVLNQLFTSPEAPLLSGILLGDDSAMPEELTQAYQATGTAHIIAISGFNMAILAGLFAGLFGRLFSRWWALVSALLALALYTLLVGAGPAVVRAALMSGISLAAIQIGRPGGGLNALMLTAGVMALFNPDLPWDVSFQLSFTATLGLILYASRIEGWFTGLLEKRFPVSSARKIAGPVCEYLLFTLAAQATSLPVMIYHFQRLSLSALVANPLVLPPQPFVMVLGGLAVLGGMFFEPLGRILAALAWPFAAYTNRAVELLAQIPGGQVSLGQSGLGWVVVYYAALLGLTLGWSKVKANAPRLRPAFVLLAAGGLAVFAGRSALAAPDGRLHLVVYNLDGQAAALLRGPQGQALLVNGAKGTARLAAGLGRWLPPGQRRLDALLVTSAQSASIQGLPGVMEQFPPREIYLGAALPETGSGKALNEAILTGEIPAYSLESGQSLQLGPDARLRVVLRGKDGCALMIEMGSFRALLPGGVALKELADENLAGLSVLLLTAEDLKSTPTEDWRALGAQAVISSQPGTWVVPPPGGWVHVVTDGVRMWVEEGR